MREQKEWVIESAVFLSTTRCEISRPLVSTLYSSKTLAAVRLLALRCVATGILLTTLFVTGVEAQFQTNSPMEGQTPLALRHGALSGSYPLSGFDRVNPFSGKLDFAFPLLDVNGRGQARYTMMARIESKPWHYIPYLDPILGLQKFADPGDQFPTLGSGYEPLRVYVRPIRILPTSDCDSLSAEDDQIWLTRITVVTADGSEIELRDVSTDGRVIRNGCFFNQTGINRGTVFVSNDGTSMTFISDAAIVDQELQPPLSGYLLTRDGVRYRIGTSYVRWMRDRNGNTLNFSYDTQLRLTKITDSLAREITFLYGVDTGDNFNQIRFNGFGGAVRTIKLWVSDLGSSLRSPYQLMSLRDLEIADGDDLWNTGVISAIELPNGRKYEFKYNSHADLARVELPTGGAYEYDHEMVQVIGQAPRNGFRDGMFRKVKEKRTYSDGVNLESVTTFNPIYSTPPGSNWPYISDSAFPAFTWVTVDQLDAQRRRLSRTKHHYFGVPFDSLFKSSIDYPGWQEGREFQTEVFAADGETVLLREQQTFQQRTSVTWWSQHVSSQGLGWGLRPTYEPSKDPRLIESVTTLVDTNQVSKTTAINPSDLSVGFDQFNNRTDVWEYDFGDGDGQPGALKRRTHTDYLVVNPVNLEQYTATSIHIRGLPAQQQVFNSAGQEQARTTFEYDNYTTADFHAALVSHADISGLCTVVTSPTQCDNTNPTAYHTRGNVTSITRYLLTNGNVTGSISAYMQYDVAGNMVKAIDPRSTPSNIIATTIDFSDRFGAPDGEAISNSGPTELGTQKSYAFPTVVTNPSGHIFHTQFEYYLGRPVDIQDPNGVVTSAYSDVNELLDRPKRVIRAANRGVDVKSQTTFIYNDVDRTITTTSDQATFNDNALKNQIVYDGLGRMVETQQYENNTQYIAVRQTPFIVLQDPDTLAWVSASQSSNPFRPYLGEQPVWTTAFADALGRTSKIRTPDNAIVRTTYSGSSVTVADQTGRQRKSISDALGRLKEVYEAPNDEVNFNYLTSYSYDTLDNLTTVTQGSQTRTFVYDSIKRLMSATNPESGTTSYQYDVNGNLTQKSDARGVVTTFAPYDPLNRPTIRSYSDGTPTVNYAYDAVGVENSKGRLTSISSSVSTYNYSSYDALGRAKTGIETIGSQTYPMAYSYDLAGHVKSINYPSGHTVSYNYDGAGRLGDKDAQNLAFTGNLGDGGTPRNYSTGITYSPFGGLSQERFGTSTPIYNKLFYNIRGQLSEIREGLTPNNTSWQRGAVINHYSNGFGCWGASCNAADNNGNLMRQEHWIQDGNDNVQAIFTQQYEYDQLNRLKRVYDGTAWQQAYSYDRYGNRRIDGAATFGQNINNMQAAVVVNTTTNRMYAPGETEANHPLINYDPAGNQTKDYFSDPVLDYDRTYDAENRMITATTTSSQTNAYSYDADGRRVIRNMNGVVTWQVYGFGGELLAEYAANAPFSSPQKEYGYRNGQLLITASVTTAWGSPPVLHDNPLVLNQTTVQARHITELREAINALRSHLAMPAYSWQTSATTNDWISANPILEMRTALDQALGAPSGGYSPGLAQLQIVKAIHIQELRNRVLAAWISGGGIDIRWLVSDHLGTPRIVFDQSGSHPTLGRHDYLPFGEELFAGTAGRTSGLGYTNSDSARQRFTSKERDIETRLDYFGARYHSATQGRFTGVDPIFITLERLIDPQRLNLYSYAKNSPLRFVDADGMDLAIDAKTEEEARRRYELFQKGLKKEDRSHTQFFVGDGKNGYEKGKFYVKIDSGHKSDSGNFTAVQAIANDRGATGMIILQKGGETITQMLAVRDGKKVSLVDPSKHFGEDVSLTLGPQPEGDISYGITLYPTPKQLVEGQTYGAGKYIGVYVWNEQSDVEVIATMFHELRAHVYLSNMGRDIPKSNHGAPGVNDAAKAAEAEARKNFKSN